MTDDKSTPRFSSARRYVLTGLLTVIPIWITWLVIKFILDLLAGVSGPRVNDLQEFLRPHIPLLADWLEEYWFQTILAVILIVMALYLLGWLATKVIGQQLIAWFDAIMERIPLVKTIYSGVKKILAAFQREPDNIRRVVLINFPSPEMKTVGLVTRTFSDADTGRQLAAVYVPTTPNPTSGYLEIVPIDKITNTNWTVDEAMTFIVSGGAVTPDRINYERSSDRPPSPPQQPAA